MQRIVSVTRYFKHFNDLIYSIGSHQFSSQWKGHFTRQIFNGRRISPSIWMYIARLRKKPLVNVFRDYTKIIQINKIFTVRNKWNMFSVVIVQ